MTTTSHHRTTAPRVSMGLPVYNAQRFLPAALDALLAQTCSDFELIISDNGSTDETPTICQDYAATDRRLCFHGESENRGACWNFNRVAQLAQAEYFKWAASDDLCEPTFVERCVAVLEADRSIVCCHSRTRKIDADGKVLTHLPDPTLASSQFLAAPRASRRFGNVLLHCGWAARSYGVIRRELLMRTPLIQPFYGSEKVLMSELALLGRFHDLPETLFSQRIHEGASSNLETAEQQQHFFSPHLATRRNFPRLKTLQGYYQAVRRVRLPFAERARCLFWITRYLMQVNKWNTAARSFLNGKGNGAAGRELVVTQTSAQALNAYCKSEIGV